MKVHAAQRLRLLAATALLAAVLLRPRRRAASAAAAHGTGIGSRPTATVGEHDPRIDRHHQHEHGPGGSLHAYDLDILVVRPCGRTGPTPTATAPTPDLGVVRRSDDRQRALAGTACAGIDVRDRRAEPASNRDGVRFTPSLRWCSRAPDAGDADVCRSIRDDGCSRVPTTDASRRTPASRPTVLGLLVRNLGIAGAGHRTPRSALAPPPITIAAAEPGLVVLKGATPLSRPEPGGTFAFVPSPSPTPRRCRSRSRGSWTTCTATSPRRAPAPTPWAPCWRPGDAYACEFPGELTGNAGATQTDVVTVTAVDDEGNEVTDEDDAVVALTDVPPSVRWPRRRCPRCGWPRAGCSRSASRCAARAWSRSRSRRSPTTCTATSRSAPARRAAPPSARCSIPARPSACTFEGELTGAAGSAQTDVVTVTVTDDEGSTGTAQDDATIRLVAPGEVPTSTSSTSTTRPPSPTTTARPHSWPRRARTRASAACWPARWWGWASSSRASAPRLRAAVRGRPTDLARPEGSAPPDPPANRAGRPEATRAQDTAPSTPADARTGEAPAAAGWGLLASGSQSTTTITTVTSTATRLNQAWPRIPGPNRR